MEEMSSKEIKDLLRTTNKLLTLNLAKGLSQIERLNLLYDIGIGNNEIVDIIGLGGEKLGLTEDLKIYEIYGILREAKFSNKEIAKIFGITESGVKSLLSQHKNDIERLLNERRKQK